MNAAIDRKALPCMSHAACADGPFLLTLYPVPPLPCHALFPWACPGCLGGVDSGVGCVPPGIPAGWQVVMPWPNSLHSCSRRGAHQVVLEMSAAAAAAAGMAAGWQGTAAVQTEGRQEEVWRRGRIQGEKVCEALLSKTWLLLMLLLLLGPCR